MTVIARIYRAGGTEEDQAGLYLKCKGSRKEAEKEEGLFFSREMSSNIQAMAKIHLIHSLP